MTLPCLLLAPLLATALAADADPVEVLDRLRAAMREAERVQYAFVVTHEAPVEGTVQRIEGLARMMTADDGPRQFVAGTIVPTASAGGDPFEVSMSRVGDVFHVANRADRVLFRADDVEVGRRLTAFADPALLTPFVAREPFERSGDGGDVTLDGTAEVAGELCDVLVIPGRPGVTGRWFVARSDGLPRAMERVTQLPIGPSVVRLELSSIRPDASLTPEDFRLTAPAGWRTVSVDATTVAPPRQAPPRRGANGLLSVGERAPAFELPTPDGGTLSSEELLGQVVVLDFWATWCPPCRRAMPSIQRLHDDYGERGVRVIGVSTSERRKGDPAGMMAAEGFDYGLLLHGERVAPFFGVQALPTMYILGPDGTVLHASRGFDPGEDRTVRRVLDAALAR